MTDNHPFDRATALTRSGDGTLNGTTSPDYSNIAGPFGGVTAAALLRAVLEHDDRAGDPVSLTVNFCGAMPAGDFVITPKLQRTGKYTQHWSLELAREGTVFTTASVVCGRRASVFSHQPDAMPSAPEPASCPSLPTAGRMNWLQRYDFRFAEGAPAYAGEPFSEPASARSVMWVSDLPERPLDYLSLAALSDTFILRLVHVRGTLAPMGTVSLTTYFHATTDELADQGSAPLLGVANGKRFHANFHDQDMELWGANSTLLASGTQIVWYKE
ncbi:MAG: acyl-CoA thioesterase [Hyphomicrobiales bacterium]